MSTVVIVVTFLLLKQVYDHIYKYDNTIFVLILKYLY